MLDPEVWVAIFVSVLSANFYIVPVFRVIAIDPKAYISNDYFPLTSAIIASFWCRVYIVRIWSECLPLVVRLSHADYSHTGTIPCSTHPGGHTHTMTSQTTKCLYILILTISREHHNIPQCYFTPEIIIFMLICSLSPRLALVKHVIDQRVQ